MIIETTIENNTTTAKLFIWRLDLSQTLQGTGGIGGLLATITDSSTNLHTYDANGNTAQLIDSETGTTAHCECGPYGNTILATGSEASNNTLRFSTKYSDDETGLIYYGYRYYMPELGRWLNRDPIGEKGGHNLYAFVTNIPIFLIDLLGNDCIVLTDRKVTGTGPGNNGLFYHYALERWQGCCPELHKQIEISDWMARNKNCKSIDKVELLSKPGNKAWIGDNWRTQPVEVDNEIVGLRHYWVYRSINIAVITYDFSDGGNYKKSWKAASIMSNDDYVDQYWSQINTKSNN